MLIMYTPSITASTVNIKLNNSLTTSASTKFFNDTSIVEPISRHKRFVPKCDSVLARMVLKGCTLDISQIISGDNEIVLTLNKSVALFYNNLKIERKIDYLNYHFIEKISDLLKVDSSDIITNYSQLISSRIRRNK